MSQLLRDLIEATPLPVDVGDDIGPLLASLEAMLARRQAILDAATSPIDHDPTLLAELYAREAAWERAIATALERVRGQRIGTAKVRAYTTGVG